MFSLAGRVAVVTGASSGLGAQLAKAFSKQGAKVVLLARRAEKLKGVEEEIRAAGGDALSVQCDVTKLADVQNAVKATLAKYGKVDILLNSAGSSKSGKSSELSDEDWQFVIDLNLTATFRCSREFGREMLKNGYGRIINIASVHGMTAVYGLTPNPSYVATKGAVVNLTKALGSEWAKSGVTVNAIGPGYFPSELTGPALAAEPFQNYIKTYCPAGRLGKDGELDAAAVFLASDEASYVTGITVYVDGGWTAI